MSDQQPRDFYIGDEVYEKADDDWEILRVLLKIPHCGEVLIDTGDDAFPLPIHTLVHASDGAPLGKFRGVRNPDAIPCPDPEYPYYGYEHGWNKAIEYVNRILGAEVDE